ncbi:MAG: 2-amino-4-hydroxy-6-hydroxymethyldihydropteridine diphosphokinase [Crocinitomicaceae bacterium]|nr:2-amino-4-hydroxy-6-hydroxymethyldihydropteridine diphosphokinase [Crocinitomicaceae bacterium]
MKNTAYISLGSNIGNKTQNISLAINEIAKSIGEVLKKSSNYISEPWGFNSSEKFVNAAISIQTKYSPIELLKKLQLIEKKMGRIRSQQNGYADRIIDLDIIYFNNEIVTTIDLKIPHPNLHIRNFVLVPLNEIVPLYIDPSNNKTINELLENCSDEITIQRVLNNNSL